MEDEIKIKVVIMGGAYSGKTTFINYYFGENLDMNNYQTTASTRPMNKRINIFNREINLEFWDTPGQEQYDCLMKFFFNDCQMIFIFYDSSDKASFQRAKKFFNMVKDNTNDKKLVIVLVSSKYDLYVKSKENMNRVSDEEALEYASKNNIPLAHISIVEKYDNGINELIDKALKEYIKKNYNLYV